MSGHFDGKVCVVTGAASGIGYAVSDALLQDGAVVLADHDADRLASGLAVTASWLLHTEGISTLSLGWLMAVKAVYCGVPGFVVARCVILRRLFS